jgi:hypothetical protein
MLFTFSRKKNSTMTIRNHPDNRPDYCWTDLGVGDGDPIAGPIPDKLDEDAGDDFCDECGYWVYQDGHAKGCPWGDDTDTDYEQLKDREMGL